MRSLWLANLINIALDPILIFGLGPIPAMGVTGAAVATTVGRGIGVLYQFRLLARGRCRATIGRAQLRIRPKVMARLVRISGIGIFQFLVATTSYLGLTRVLAALGNDDALAGFAIAVRIIVFAVLPAWGMANAAATLVGQNLGAGKPDRAERSAWMAVRYNMLFLATVGVTFLVIAGPLVTLFIDDPEVIRHGADCLRIVSLCYAFYAFKMVLAMSFHGAGDTSTPTAINLGVHWIFKIPIAITLSAAVYVLLFRRGRWKSRVV
jgi:putative MATE family efflux protein